MSSYSERCKKIWEGYQLYASLCAVDRRGYELVGLTSYSTKDSPNIGDVFDRRGESDLEHQAKTAWLCSVFASNFPDYFEMPSRKIPTDVWLLVTTALCHDVGEAKTGDIPDDGRAEHELKNLVELQVFCELAGVFDYVDQEKSINTFRQFQNRDSHIGKALFALDKAEAVLTTIFLAKHGDFGHITFKDTVTERDEYFMSETRSDSPMDCWAAHLQTVTCDFPVTITDPIYSLIDTAIRDVYGVGFSWWNKGIKPWAQ